MYLRYQEEPLRPFSADWQNWMINNTDEDDVLLVSSSLVEFDSGPVWSCQGEMIAFSQNLDGSKLIDYVDEHDEVTMVVIPWHHERDEGIRSEFEDRGWSREVQHNYMGGYLSWIIHHRPT